MRIKKINRRWAGRLLFFAALLVSSISYAKPPCGQPPLVPLRGGIVAFRHPGVLQSREDLERMRTGVAAMAEPLYSGYKVFAGDSASLADYRMQGPLKMVGRNPTVGQTAYDNDANAAYQNAVMWAITGDRRHAEKAIAIIDAWSSTLNEITGRDAVLMAGLGPFKMVNAAEIIRYTNAGWSEEGILRAEANFKAVVYPVIKDFAPFANGNWDAAAIKTSMAIGVFCNDRSIFERALRYYIDGWGNGSLLHYVINEQGQLQESGRDQPHAQLGIGMLAECCAIAWNQGLDLYSLDDNRLLKGFEYTAKFNLGNDDVPFSEWLDRTGKYHHDRISQQGRGRLRAVYEQVYNHYVVMKGLSAPFVQQAAEKLRPEGAGRPGADHPGYGTLLFSNPSPVGTGLPSAPAGLIAAGSASSVELSWVPSIHAVGYAVWRADKPDGPYKVVAADIRDHRWTDRAVVQGRLYYYTVSAHNGLGESVRAYRQAVFSGLPGSWRQQDIGDVQPGSTVFDGTMLTTEASGMGVDSTRDGLHFTYFPLCGDGRLTVRLVPQPSSQFSTMGLMLRINGDRQSPMAALMINPGKAASVEAPDWHISLMARTVRGGTAVVCRGGENIKAPAVTYGRLTGYYWLRLERRGNTCRGFVSYDGVEWKDAGSVEVVLGKECWLGMAVGSGMQHSTVVRFDHVEGRSLAGSGDRVGAAPSTSAGATHVGKVTSPDGSTVFEATVDHTHRLRYRVLWEGKEMLEWSAMGFDNGEAHVEDTLVAVSKSSTREKFAWPLGENDSVVNHYNALVLGNAAMKYHIAVRVYNGSVAFRYEWADDVFGRETTGFALKKNYTLYQYNQESVFTPTAIDTLSRTCDLPATLTDGRVFLSIGEAANDGYTKAELARGRGAHELAIVYTNDSAVSGIRVTPWRTISMSKTAIGLHAFSDLGLRLSPAPEEEMPPGSMSEARQSSLKPGKLIRAQLTTQAGLDCIDFAARHHFQYILYDAGWYGAERSTTSDPLAAIPAIDLPKVIAYGKERGIGVILYVNYVGLRKKLDSILPLYKQWGVAGLKFGFVDGLTQHGIRWLADAIRKVNSYGFILDIHDNYKPTGLSRTFPSLLTQEGIRGDEHGPDAWHTTVLPYTRFLAGAADFTFCFPNAAGSFSKNLKVSKAQQLALTVIYYSPLQSMFWYGRPADYTNEDEIEFFKYVPTVWDETRYLAGDIGKNIAVARRQGDTWYLGCAAGMEDWDTVVKMDFLKPGRDYHITVYEDDGKGGIRRRMMTLRRGSRLPVRIRAKGGMAMICN